MTSESGPSALAVQPNEAESYWQPVPANGFVEIHVSRYRTETLTSFESGIQVVAPGSRVRDHAHDPHEELIMVFEGEGKAVIEGEEHRMQPGTTLYLAPNWKHTFINEGDGPLRFFWVLMPGGLGDFFSEIGRPREAGQPAPAPFPRPDNVEQIERKTVFSHADQDS